MTDFSPSDLLRLVRVAERAAEDAVTALGSGGGRTVLSDTAHDTRLEADVALDRRIAATLATTPFPVMSEESEATHELLASNGPLWIVDPLDGTVNYSRGIPFYAISIALWSRARPVLGVVIDPVRGERFTAATGLGAWIDGRPMAVSRLEAASDAILCSGLPVRAAWNDETIGEFVTEAKRFKKVRYLGSAALSLAYVAAGRADVYRERGVAYWDFAAGLALVCGAGGAYTLDPCDPPILAAVTASNPKLLSTLCV